VTDTRRGKDLVWKIFLRGLVLGKSIKCDLKNIGKGDIWFGSCHRRVGGGAVGKIVIGLENCPERMGPL
jgi:hypothetical protein